MVATKVAAEPADFDEFIDLVAARVADYLDSNPDEYYAEVVVPTAIAEQYSDEEIEAYLAWLPDLLQEAGVEDRCLVTYDGAAREIRVERT